MLPASDSILDVDINALSGLLLKQCSSQIAPECVAPVVT
jgi:hypothetical protein